MKEITLKEAAELLSPMSLEWVYHHATVTKKIPVHKRMGSRYFFKESDILKIKEEGLEL